MCIFLGQHQGTGKDDCSPGEKKKEDNNQSSKETSKEPQKEPDKDNQKADPKDSQKNSPKKAPKNSKNGASKSSHKDAPKDAPKDSPKNSPKDAPKHSQKNAKNGATKSSHKDAPKDAPKDSQKDVHKDVLKGQKNVQVDSPNHSNKDGEVDVPKDIIHDGERVADKDNHKDDPHDDYDHVVTMAKGTHHASKNRSASADILREILRRQLADEGHGPAAALPGNQPRLPALAQAQQLYAPLGSSGVGPAGQSRIPDYYGMSTAPQSTRNLGFGSCSCHPACNCQKPCSCEPSPCPCKGPSVSSIHSAGSGTIISSVVPIPVPYPMPGYDGGAGGSGNIANARPNEPIIINPYPPSTSSAPPQPPAPANPAPITVHDIVSLMTSLMLKNFRDDLLRRWGLPVPDDATTAAATPVRATVPESAAVTAPQVPSEPVQ
ncbi:uncharacterized protein LOC119462066 [Dermacentor silvarum]|uniref:uncharacterized protein LOC119462066 n=1 Tax=Dermacentor silvarum TaxID=543639 RepID=UPI0018974C1E|nr:uncharacterized protein LOC119462066 [Dermacentor silvarum]